MIGTKDIRKRKKNWDVGCVYHNLVPRYYREEQDEEERKPMNVEACDGLLLATQTDVSWRTDLFSDWHSYDYSLCLEMKRAGYRVVVPYQTEPWCMHDCTPTSSHTMFDEQFSCMMREYFDEDYVPEDGSKRLIRRLKNLSKCFGIWLNGGQRRNCAKRFEIKKYDI